jgi:ferrous iron transport protein B
VLVVKKNKKQKIALLGNPNVGKSSLFNALTGLNQRVGNFPGVTVDKKTGLLQLSEDKQLEILDLPGLYSLFVKSADEAVVLESLIITDLQIDLLLVVLDACNLERSLMLYTQAKDLGFDVIPVLTMNDLAIKQGIKINLNELSNNLGRPIFEINPRKDKGIKELKSFLADYEPLNNEANIDFKNRLLLGQYDMLKTLSIEEKTRFRAELKNLNKDQTDIQLDDTLQRMNTVHGLLENALHFEKVKKNNTTSNIDKIITHPVFGYIIYFGLLLLIFQFIFSVAEYPMNWIDSSFAALNYWLKSVLPASALSDLLTEGLIAGIGGIVIFIPQIAILFAFIAVLEESGYMSRVVYLMDKPMRLFGLNGKSVVPLISGAACAVPAIMSARGIESYKERLITIFVTPFISCSARLPVYIIIIALIIPQGTILGFSYKGLTLMGLYLLGIIAALLTSVVMSKLLKSKDKSLFIIDLPSYRMPRWKNICLTVYQKSGTFVLEAGKIILAISIILWALASYGPPEAMKAAEQKTEKILLENPELNKEEVLAAQKLEASFIGHFGHFIEPAISPLGYDWKIGIALITSFAAREVFVGTLGTIYSVGEDDFDKKLVDKMRNETFRDGRKVFNLASGLSLLVFYVFAMQCMSTVAIVYRETGGWKWPLIQLFYMTGLAWLAAYIVYSLLS